MQLRTDQGVRDFLEVNCEELVRVGYTTPIIRCGLANVKEIVEAYSDQELNTLELQQYMEGQLSV